MPALGQTNEGLGLTGPQPAGGVQIVGEGDKSEIQKDPMSYRDVRPAL